MMQERKLLYQIHSNSRWSNTTRNWNSKCYVVVQVLIKKDQHRDVEAEK